MTGSKSRALFLLLLYSLMLAFMTYYHEPWRDEIEMWLMARDAGVAELLALAPNMGAPLLWPLILMPLAKAGLPVESMQALHAVLAMGAVALMLFNAPFPALWKLLIAFTYYLSFEYSVVARNYCPGILLLFALLSLDRRRAEFPYSYGVLLALLSHTSVHFFMIANVLLGMLFVDVMLQKQKSLIPALALGALGSLSCVLVLWPRGDGQFKGLVVSNLNIAGGVQALMGSVFPYQRGAVLMVAAVVLWALLLVYLLPRARAFWFTVLSLLLLEYVFIFKHIGGIWHFGLLFIVLLAGLWLGEETEALSERSSLRRFSKLVQPFFQLLFTVSLATSFYVQARNFYVEFSQSHSLAKDMAERLRSTRLLEYTIAAHPAPITAALLAYLPGTRFWYIGIEEYGTYMKWDAAHVEGRFLRETDLFKRIARAFPNYQSVEEPVLVLLNEPIEDPDQYGYVLFESTISIPWRIQDERYYLYVPIDFAKKRAAGFLRRMPQDPSAESPTP